MAHVKMHIIHQRRDSPNVTYAVLRQRRWIALAGDSSRR